MRLMDIEKGWFLLHICMIVACSLTACGSNQSIITAYTESSTGQSEGITTADRNDSAIQAGDENSGHGDTSVYIESSGDELLGDAADVDVDIAEEKPEGYEIIGGSWTVGGIYIDGQLIDVNDNADIKSMYKNTLLVFNDDGTFDYLVKLYNNSGTWSKKGEGTEEKYILDTESTSMYSLRGWFYCSKGHKFRKEAVYCNLT